MYGTLLHSPHAILSDLSWILFPFTLHNMLRISLSFLSLSVNTLKYKLINQNFIPGDVLQVLPVPVSRVQIHPGTVQEEAEHLHLVGLETVHDWSVSVRVLDVPVNSIVSHNTLLTTQHTLLHTSVMSLSFPLLHSNLSNISISISTSPISKTENTEIEVRNRLTV